MQDRLSEIRAEAARQGLLARKTARELFVPFSYQVIALLTVTLLIIVIDHPALWLVRLGVVIWMFVSAWRV